MGQKSRDQFRDEIDTSTAYMYWLNRAIRLASSAVEWVGLPYTIDPIYLENTLNRGGSAIIVYDEVVDDYFCGTNASMGEINIYGYPKDRRVVFMNGHMADYTPETSCIIYNNSMRTADLWYYQYVAKRMANIDMAVDVNMLTQKTMPIIPTTMNKALTIKNLLSAMQANIPYQIVDESTIDVETLKSALTFDNRKSFTSDLMVATQQKIWNQLLTMIGVNNINIEKKERTNVPEINSNLDEILIMRRDRLNARQRACEIMQEKWGLKVSVRYYSEGGEIVDGNLYDTGIGDMSAGLLDQAPDNRPMGHTDALPDNSDK